MINNKNNRIDPVKEFEKEKAHNINELGNNPEVCKLAIDFIHKTAPNKYSYNFTWMGRPIIAFPTDMVAMQEIIWDVKPDLIIETGIAHGGSLIYYASILELLGGERKVLGIDIDIRRHNRIEIEMNPMSKRIIMLEGSSISNNIYSKVEKIAKGHKSILVCLDSNHTHDHVLKELEFYSKLVSLNSYCVVFDTIIEDLPEGFVKDRSWDKGNNPKTAVGEFIKNNSNFVVDSKISGKLLITVAPGGFLKRVK